MRYVYQDQNHEWIGPYTMEELRQLHLNGIIKPDTPTMVEGGNTTVLFKDLWSKLRIHILRRKLHAKGPRRFARTDPPSADAVGRAEPLSLDG